MAGNNSSGAEPATHASFIVDQITPGKPEPGVAATIDGLTEMLENIRRENPDASGPDFVFLTAAGKIVQSHRR
jgi:hypothetical protein